MAETALTLSWQDNSDREAGFLVERKTGLGAYAQVAVLDAARAPEPTVVSYNDTGLVEATSYTYRVRAYNAGGDSAYSNEATGITLPAAPSGLAATDISGTEIDLVWVDHSSGETGFKIERKVGAGAYSQIATVGANVTSYANTGLTSGTSYTYRVKAYNAGGDSAYSNESSATTTSGDIDTANLLWNHEADDIIGLSNGALVATWPDSSGNGLDYTQSVGAKKFTYHTNVQNGLAAVQATDDARFMTLSGYTRPRGDLTVYFVVNYTPGGTEQFCLSTQTGSGGFSMDASETDNNLGFFVSGNAFEEGPAAVSGWQVLTYVMDFGSGQLRTYRNGVLQHTQNGAVNNGDTDTVWDIGAASGFLGLVGYFGEDAAYSVAHDDAGVLSNATALKTKWGIP